MKKKKNINSNINKINVKTTTLNVIFVFVLLIVLIVLNVAIYNSEAYLKHVNIDTIGVLWTIIGFAFTIYCVVIPKLSKTIALINKIENTFGTEKFYNLLKKDYFKFKRTELLYNLLQIFIFGCIGFLVLLTFGYFRLNDSIPNLLQIGLNVLLSLVLTFSSFTYIILIIFCKHHFDITDGLIDDEIMDEFENSCKSLNDTKIKNELIEQTSDDKKDSKH